MNRSTVIAVALALTLCTPSLAHAQAPEQRALVRVGDLGTSTDRGADRALSRIRRAAQEVCDAPPGLRLYDDRVAARACVHNAMSRAVDDLGDPTVAARFNGGRIYAAAGARS